MDNKTLTEKEIQTVKTLNYIAKFDGIITDHEEMMYLMERSIEKFIAPKRQYLVSLTKTAYPIRIKFNFKRINK